MRIKLILFTLFIVFSVVRANCTVTVTVAKGTEENPIYLFYDGTAFDDIPYSDFVSDEWYYEIDGLTSGLSYYIDLFNLTGNVDLEVYTDVDFTNQVCGGSNSGTGNESCLAQASGTSLFVRVIYNGGGSGANYEIDVY